MISARALAKALYIVALKALRRDVKLLERIRERALVVGLNLHRVSPYPNPYWSPVHPKHFDELVSFLKKSFTLTTFAGLASCDAHARRPIALLSFDDGYQDFVEYAMPVLHKHGVAANMNVIPACVESGKPIWNVQMYDALDAAPRSFFDKIAVPGFTRRLEADDPYSKARYGAALSGYLKKRPRAEREELWRDLEPLLATVDVPRPTAMMREADVKEAARAHEIGVHSYGHESMGFETDEYFERDLDACFAFFRRIGLPMTVYAFPNGSHRPSQIDTLLARGIEHVLLVEEKLGVRGARVHPRLTISGQSRWELELEALGYQARGIA